MSNISFFIHCIPPKHTAQGSNRIMKRKNGSMFVGKFATSKGKKTQNELMTILHPFAPKKPLDGALNVRVWWLYPWLKSEPNKNRYGLKPCSTRPDVDNLCKMLFDCMTRLGFWLDDGQIATLTFHKAYSDDCGIKIEVSEIEMNPKLKA